MALQISIDNIFGSPATYWRVFKTNMDWEADVGRVVLCGYISKDIRDAGKAPIDKMEFKWEGANNPFIENGYDILDDQGTVIGHVFGLDEKTPRKLAYKAIKDKPMTILVDGREVEVESPFKNAGDV